MTPKPTSPPTPSELLPWSLLLWWFLGLAAYHLFLEHRAHVFGALPYVIAAGVLVLGLLGSRYAARRTRSETTSRRGRTPVSSTR